MSGANTLLLDGDPLFKGAFGRMLADQSLGRKVEVIRSRHPNMNAHAERVVRTVKDYLRGYYIGEGGLHYALREIEQFYNHERLHQGLGGRIPVPDERANNKNGAVVRFSRLGRLLNYYHREAA